MEDFENLLGWLSPNREQAAIRYEDIRRRLIRIFMHRGCVVAEDLADETIERVTRKIKEVRKTYGPDDDPAPYFYKVSQFIYKEYRKRICEPVPPPPPEDEGDDDLEPQLDCLDRCLDTLAADDRELILAYYPSQERNIDGRKKLAERVGLSLNALRIKACRIRSALEDCVYECLKKQTNVK